MINSRNTRAFITHPICFNSFLISTALIYSIPLYPSQGNSSFFRVIGSTRVPHYLRFRHLKLGAARREEVTSQLQQHSATVFAFLEFVVENLTATGSHDVTLNHVFKCWGSWLFLGWCLILIFVTQKSLVLCPKEQKNLPMLFWA